MTQYFVYILKSTFFDRYYIGQTANLQDRIHRHNRGDNKSTNPYKPWDIFHVEIFPSRSEAIKREMFLKSPKGWNELQEIKKNPSINKIS